MQHELIKDDLNQQWRGYRKAIEIGSYTHAKKHIMFILMTTIIIREKKKPTISGRFNKK